MTNEEYREQYKELTNKITQLTRSRQKLDIEYAESESNKFNIFHKLKSRQKLWW